MKGQILMIEGPDGVGKSTLAMKVGPAKYRHYGPPMATNWAQAWGHDAQRDGMASERAVWDRGPFGHPIWTELLGGDLLYYPHELAEVVAFFHAVARIRVVILLRADMEMHSELAAREERSDRALASVSSYLSLMRTLTCMGVNVSIWNSTQALAAEPESWWTGW